MIPVTFVFNGYENNPIVKMCLAQQPRCIMTEKDLMPYIRKLRYSKWAWENGLWSFVGDELRLYFASMLDDFLYIDADVIVENPDDIKMDCVPPDLNNGTFFRANKNTPWVKYYLNLYEKEDVGRMVNYRVFKTYPYEMPVQDNIRYKHFYTSFWERYRKRDRTKNHALLFDAEDEIRAVYKKDIVEWHYFKDCEKFIRVNKDYFLV